MSKIDDLVDNLSAFKNQLEERMNEGQGQIGHMELRHLLSRYSIPHKIIIWNEDLFGTPSTYYRIVIGPEEVIDIMSQLQMVLTPDEWVKSLRIGETPMVWSYPEESKETFKKVLKVFKENRLKWIVGRIRTCEPSVYGISRNYLLNGCAVRTYRIDGEQDNHKFKLDTWIDFAAQMINRLQIKATKYEVKEAAEAYAGIVKELEIKTNENRSHKNLESILNERIKMNNDGVGNSYQEFALFADALDNGPTNLAQRSWGFEMEIADAKGVEVGSIKGVEKGDDGSLRSYNSNNECECDCRDCMYHECNCDFCDSYNDSPEHCGDSHCANADSAEFRSVGAIAKTKHHGLKLICQELENEDAEVNDTCGIHIHVFAADLKSKQVAQLLAIYSYLRPVLAPIAGRENTHYAQRLSSSYIAKTIKTGEFSTIKQVEVNVNNLNTRGTIEFRQMSGTYNYKEIHAWAWIVRGLVNAVAKDATIGHFMKVNTFNELVEVLRKFKHNIKFENMTGVAIGTNGDSYAYSRNSFSF